MPKDTPVDVLDDADRMTQLLEAFVEVDPTFLPFLGGVMGMFKTSPWPAELSKYVFGPIVVHSATNSGKRARGQDIGWLTSDLIEKYKPRVYAERVELANGKRPDLVSPTELWMTMYNAVHDSPLLHPLTQIYCWAVHRSMQAGGFVDAEKLTKHHLDCRIILDREVFGDDWTYAHTYRDLAQEVRQKVIRHSEYRVGPERKPKPNWPIAFE